MKQLTYMRKVGLCLFLFALFSPQQGISQTDLVVNYYDGSSQNYSITEDGKLYFDNDDLVISTGTTSDVTIPISIIQKITFPSNQAVGIESLQSVNNELFLFPNPTKDHFRISSSSTDRMQVKIYNTSGKLVQSGEYYSNDLILISQLESGLYLVTVNNQPYKLNKL